jgi:hypothetical protein
LPHLEYVIGIRYPESLVAEIAGRG